MFYGWVLQCKFQFIRFYKPASKFPAEQTSWRFMAPMASSAPLQRIALAREALGLVGKNYSQDDVATPGTWHFEVAYFKSSG